MTALLLAIAVLMTPPHPRRRFLIGPGRRRSLPACAVVCAVPTLIAVIMVSPELAVVATAAAVLLTSRRRAVSRRRQRHREGEALTAALETVVGELRVGAHPLQAFGIAAAESSGFVGGALRTITAQVGLGAGLDAGIRSVSAESAVPFYWDRIAVCWRLASEHGLAMVTLMRAAQCDIVDRQRFSGRVDASLAGARATAAILAGLPGLGILLGELVGAHPISFLLGGGAGGVLLILGAGLEVAGVLWSDRIVDRLAS